MRCQSCNWMDSHGHVRDLDSRNSLLIQLFIRCPLPLWYPTQWMPKAFPLYTSLITGTLHLYIGYISLSNMIKKTKCKKSNRKYKYDNWPVPQAIFIKNNTILVSYLAVCKSKICRWTQYNLSHGSLHSTNVGSLARGVRWSQQKRKNPTLF